jgi:hypothetical protein
MYTLGVGTYASHIILKYKTFSQKLQQCSSQKRKRFYKYFHLIFCAVEERKVEQLPHGTN